MDELVIRPDRAPGFFITAVFVVLFVSSLWTFFGMQPAADLSALVFVGLCQAVFGAFIVLGMLRIFTPALRLTRDGFEIGKGKVAWADVEDFEIVKVRSQGIPLPDRIKVVYSPGLQRSWIDVALGSIALGRAPTYLYATFYETGGRNLYDILRQWWRRYRDA